MNRNLRLVSKNKMRRKRKEIEVFLSSVMIFFLFYKLFPQNRVGDGSEYILQYFGFLEGHRPWITPTAVESYDRFFNSSQINFLVESDQIENTFSALSKGNNFDLNHFWLYSALAAALHVFFKFFLIELSVSDTFILLHGILFSFAITAAWRKYSYIGVMSILLLLFGSPLFWYGNKIHTEFFTFTFVLLATIFGTQSRFLAASVSMALASTQNPSFSAIALILIFLGTLKLKKSVFKSENLIQIVVTLLLCGLHPAYYLWRQGVITPQLKAGGASLGGNLEHYFLWLADPDVGLFPNWPLGIVLLSFGFFTYLRNRKTNNRDLYFVTFVVSFFLISLYAQSSTTNLNSGGTPGLARYALWYIGIFFPISTSLLVRLLREGQNFPNLILWFLLSIVTATSIYSNAPIRPEQFTNPSISSAFIQRNFSDVYSPPMPIFVGRYSGIGEDISISAVVGPDCRKIAVIADLSRTRSISPAHCGYSLSAIQQFVYEKRSNLKEDTYFKIDDILANQLRLEPTRNVIQFSSNSDGFQILGRGWSSPETWGVWTNSKEAEIFIPCRLDNQALGKFTLTVNSFGEQKVEIAINGRYTKSVYLKNSINKEIEVNVSKDKCKNGRNLVSLKTPNAKSPKELGMSEDPRLLGVGLIQISFDRRNEN